MCDSQIFLAARELTLASIIKAVSSRFRCKRKKSVIWSMYIFICCTRGQGCIPQSKRQHYRCSISHPRDRFGKICLNGGRDSTWKQADSKRKINLKNRKERPVESANQAGRIWQQRLPADNQARMDIWSCSFLTRHDHTHLNAYRNLCRWTRRSELTFPFWSAFNDTILANLNDWKFLFLPK